MNSCCRCRISSAATGSNITAARKTAPVEEYFTKWDKHAADHNLLPHEFTHSWNGKFRRPADLWTPNYDVPMQRQLALGL